jgi:hypothetical protein
MSTTISAFLLALATLARASGAGGQAGDFLRQDPTARGAAMGAAMTALSDDAASIHWNPAGLARLVKPELQATHVTLFESTSYDFVAAASAARRWGSLALGYVRQTSGDFEKRASPNDAATTFSITQSAWLVGWGLALPRVDVGATLKSVRETIDDRGASGTGADVGAIVRPGGPVTVGVHVVNLMAPKLTFVSSPISYARVYQISPAYERRLDRDWTAVTALMLQKPDGDSASVSGGAELRYRKLAAVRFGYRNEGMSTGVGVRLGNTEFGYAALLNELGVSHLLTFVQRFGHTREELEETIRRGISELSHAEGARLARAYLAKAEDELARDRIQDALRDFEAASLLDPENQALKSRIRSVSEQWDRTIRKQTVERTASLAEQQERRGNLLAARQYWKTVQELDSGHQLAVERVAHIDLSLSMDERSKLEDLRRRRDADEAAARRSRADASAKQLGEAERQAASGAYAEAVRLVEAVLRDDPGNLKLAARAAELRASAERARAQQAVTPETRKQVERLYYRAVEAYLRGDLEAADNFAKEVSRLDPASEAARTLREKIDAARRFAK